jgi:hypothetical protein
MTIAIGQKKDQGIFDFVDDWLKRIVLYSLVGLVFYYSQQRI